MVRKTALFSFGVLICAILPAAGDFKYTESSKITGGALNGMMKFAGAFSKQARQATGPMESTMYVKGNRLRKDEADGHSQIIDLDARRIINIDRQKRTYSTMTFDQMKAAMERARERAVAQNVSQPQGQKPANVKITPKVDVARTGKTATILNLPASEVQMNLDMEMQSTDPNSQGQSGSMWVKSDSWVTPNIPGYEELTAFQQKMGKELDWMPGAMLGGNPQTSQGMAQLQQHADELKGFPLLQYVSMGMAANGQTTAQGGQAQSQPAQAQPAPSQSSDSQSLSQLTDPREALAKSLGGMFGRKKKQNQDQPAAGSSTGGTPSGQPATPPSTPGSLMDMTVQVTSYSSDALDAGLFEPPVGYAQVQAPAEGEIARSSSQ